MSRRAMSRVASAALGVLFALPIFAVAADACPSGQPEDVLLQGFESFRAGTPALSDERAFKAEFCIPLRNVSGFGNDAEPPLSSLSPSEQTKRRAREAAGQFNGASSRVRLTVDRSVKASGAQSMRVLYPRGGNTSSHSGAQFDMVIQGAQVYDRRLGRIVGEEFHEELYLSYWVRFEPNFPWQFGGKLPGLYALEGYNASPRDNQVSSRLMWREDGRLEFYLHTLHDPRERLLWNNAPGGVHARVTAGRWHHIEFRMKLNSVSGSTVRADGILQGWLDGQLRADYRDLRFRNSPAVNINALVFSTFFGGSSGSGRPNEIWWPSRDVYAWFDDFTVSAPHR